MNALRSLQLKHIETCVAKHKADCAAKTSSTQFLDCQRQAQQAATALQRSVGQVSETLRRHAGAERVALWRLAQVAPQLRSNKENSQRAESELGAAQVELGQRLALCHRFERMQENVESRIESCVAGVAKRKLAAEVEEQQELRVCASVELVSGLEAQPLPLAAANAQSFPAPTMSVNTPSSAAATQLTPTVRADALPAERIFNLQASREGRDVRLACNYRLLDGTEVKIEIAHNPQLGLEILVRASGERERRQLWREKAQLLAALKAAGYAPKSVRFELAEANQQA